MKKSRNRQGNTLALVVTVAIGLLLILGFFLINYGQLFGTNKEAVTAIDAASLQAAKDLSRVVIQDPNFGPIGIVDDSPAANDPNNRPVVGINTLLATVRLDAIIASQLTAGGSKNGNTTMLFLAQQDFMNAQNAATNLTNALTNAASGGTATDKNGNTINLQTDVNQAFDNNSTRFGFAGKGGGRVGSLAISIGGVPASTITTNTPVPAQSAKDPGLTSSNSAQNGSQTFYMAYSPVTITPLGPSVNITFAAIGNAPALIDNGLFVANGKLPSVVQVSGQQKINSMIGQKLTGTIAVTSTAECGATPQTFPSGTMCVNFAGGIPVTSSSQVQFNTIQSIMNSSQITAQPSSNPKNLPTATASTYTGWNNSILNPGQYFTTNGGAFPLSPNATEKAGAYRGRPTDDPSVSLSFLAYDWLRSLYLRPSVDAVVQAFQFPLSNLTSSGTGQVFPKTSNSLDFMPPVYANGSQPNTVAISGLFDLNSNTPTKDDPRTLGSGNPMFRQQFLNVFGYVPSHTVFPNNTRIVSVNSDGSITTTNGESLDTLNDSFYAIADANQTAKQTFLNAQSAGKSAYESARALADDVKSVKSKINALQNSPSSSGSLQQLNTQIQSDMSQIAPYMKTMARAANVAMNAKFAMNTTTQMWKNLKVITGGGVKKLEPNHYQMMGVDFYPPTKVASAEDIQGDGPIETGQAVSVPVHDWTAPAKGNTPSLPIYKNVSKPVISRAAVDDPYFQPALAANSIPPNQNMMYLLSAQSNGSIEISLVPSAPFAGESLLDGQMLYQDTHALVTNNSSGQQLIWQVQARDLNANSVGTYYADESSNSGVSSNPATYCQSSSTMGTATPAPGIKGQSHACPSLVAEWVVLCPTPDSVTVPVVKPPPVTIKTPPPPPSNPCIFVVDIDNVKETSGYQYIDSGGFQSAFETMASINNEVLYLTTSPQNSQVLEELWQWQQIQQQAEAYPPTTTSTSPCATLESGAG